MKNILIVDDNRMILHSLSSFIRVALKDFNVLTAEDGEMAIELLETNPVNLILTDLEMPRVDGYQVIEYAKKNHPAVPLIIMTGSWSLDLELLVKKTGIVRCIEKPFRYEYLVDMVIEALEENTGSTHPNSPARPADGTYNSSYKRGL
jgi:DNA-binding NtrC family response regulator